MTTDEERRKVAQRLRECRGGWSSGECYYTIIHALGLPDTSREDGANALYAALADLIDPDPERTPNDDERRRVSGELERLVVYENGTTSLNHGVLWSIAAIVMPDIDERPRETVLTDLIERLAELIKPERTCRLVPMPWNGAPPYRRSNVVLDGMTDGCSECGYPIKARLRETPSFCPKCGARVVDE